MFGYIKLDEYAPRHYIDYFKKNYCFLCRALDKHYGFFSRLFVSFDVTFFTILFSENGYLSSLGKVKCFKSSDGLKERLKDEYAKKVAALNLALAAGELRDNIGDKDKFYARVAYGAYRGVFRRVKRDYPLLWEIVEKGHDEMTAIEEANGTVEDMENCFGRLIERLSREVFEITDESRLSYIVYVAKMLYFMDAVDDIDKDIKRGAFNGLKCYGSKENYVLRHYEDLRAHLRLLRAPLRYLEEKSINVATVNRIIDIGIPETLLKVCYKGVRL